MKKYISLILVLYLLPACASPDYTGNVAPDLCEQLNIEMHSAAYLECFAIAAEVHRTYPKFNMTFLAREAEEICDRANISTSDTLYPSCFKRVTMPLIEEYDITKPTWDSILQKINLIHKNYNF